MNRSMLSWLRLLACSSATVAALTGTAHADDSEIYISQANTAPNILLILDTSGSMQGQVTTQPAYDSTIDYVAKANGVCAGIGDRVYFSTGDDQGTPPACDSGAFVSTANMRCSAATAALGSSSGTYTGDRFTQWRKSMRDNDGNNRSWRTVNDGSDGPIDCRNDGSPYPDRNASAATDTPSYSNSENDSYWLNNGGGGSSATLYSANFIAYYNQFRTQQVLGTRLSVMQQAARNLLNSVTNVNVGLMRYSVNTNDANGGGMVMAPVAPIETNRAQLIALIDAFLPYGSTPLSETYYEAHQYFSGGSVKFGNTSQVCSATAPTNGGVTTNCTGIISNYFSVAGSRAGGSPTGANYATPITDPCQKNYIVYLTDGEPTSDSKANDDISRLPEFTSLVPGGCAANGQGRCLGALAEYLFERDLRSGLMGTQNVTTYFIGFGSAFGSNTSNEAFQYLQNAAIRGGGDAYQAGDLSDLSRVFTNIFNSISSTTATLTAPTVAVNAFNRTRTLDDLYISLFQPSAGIHWPGNVKKYRADDGLPNVDNDNQVLGLGDNLAIATDGTFVSTTSDYWSAVNGDGADVVKGGAARKLPDPASRNVYTYIGNNPGSGGVALRGNPDAAVVTANDSLTDDLLRTTTGNPDRDKLIRWARGADVDDADRDRLTDEQRYDIGDIMHSQPAVVIYGGSPGTQNANDAVVFTATNDGYLHAFNTSDGVELWSFIPQEMLGSLKTLYTNDSTGNKNYLIDGDLRVLKYDTNGDGIVSPGDNDRVLLFFSTGRNPSVSRYYALDVTSKTSPKFLWAIGESELAGLGQTWSRPTITRVNVNGASQNSQKLVLIFGGGYDPLEEGGAYVPETEIGNRIFMVDALRGTLLWSAGDEGTDLQHPRMKHSIPAAINVVDLDGDGFADRMYAGDMAAQLWRFDIFNGKRAGELVTGGVIASLGAKDDTASAANTRRFYNAPDSAVLDGPTTRPFMNIAIGSGYRGHPLATSNQDRFYVIRDYQPFAMLTQNQYNDFDIITDNELDDITTNFAPQLGSSSRGWKLQLNFPSYRGEKVLSSSNTFNNTIFFTSYTPIASATSNTCSPVKGSNRAYAINAFDGRPVPRSDGDTGGGDNGGDTGGGDTGGGDTGGGDTGGGTGDPNDRFVDLGQSGIAPEVTLLFPDKNKVTCLAGVEVLDVCKDFNSRIKTYWRQTNAN
jgi:type IV pilus assembly protein PilY1